MPGVEGGPSKLKYNCQCCSVTPRGCDMNRHYKRSVNWDMFKQLKGAVGEVAMEELRAKADAHTIFIFEGGYNEENLPTYHSHTSTSTRVGEEAAQETARGAGLQKSIGDFFKVRDTFKNNNFYSGKLVKLD
jgi:hypothetical protein